MSDTWVRSLAAEVGLTAERRYTVSWARAEAEVGFQLPEDYKHLVETFGPGLFDEFVTLMVPGVENPHIELAKHAELCFEIQRALILDENFCWPYAAPGEPGCLLNWAVTANGDFLYWKTEGAPDDWTVVAQPGRGDDFSEFSGSASEFLTRFLRDDITVHCLAPAEEEGATVSFEPWDGTWDEEGRLEPHGEVLHQSGP